MKRLFRGWSWEHWYNLAREDIEEAFDSVRRTARILLYCGLGLWVLSGFHTIRTNEVGLKTVCGRLTRGIEGPGLRYRLPWPVGAVRRVPKETQQKVTIGTSEAGLSQAARLGKVERSKMDEDTGRKLEGKTGDEDSPLSDAIEQGRKVQTGEARRQLLGEGLAVLTADRNVVLLTAVVQYMIVDPIKYVYGSEGAPLLLKRAAGDALLLEAAGANVDDLLTTGRTAAQDRVKTAVQTEADTASIGVKVVGVQLQRVAPPADVAAAFNGVSIAREERATLINEAEQYRNTIVTEAEGLANKLISEANGNRSDRIAQANGESSRFMGVLREFQTNPEVTAERLRIETVERIASRAHKVQAGTSPGTPFDFRFWSPLPGAGGP